MSTEHSTGAPAVAVGPYTRGPWKATEDAGHPANIRITSTARRHVAKVYALSLDRDRVAEANAALICAAPELLAACDKAAEVMGWMLWDQSDRRDKNEAYTLVKAAVARARGLRPCDDPALVPEVLKAQPQCVHGEKVKWSIHDLAYCPAHRDSDLRTQFHESDHGGWWYTYVCDGYLEEQRGRGE